MARVVVKTLIYLSHLENCRIALLWAAFFETKVMCRFVNSDNIWPFNKPFMQFEHHRNETFNEVYNQTI